MIFIQEDTVTVVVITAHTSNTAMVLKSFYFTYLLRYFIIPINVDTFSEGKDNN